MIHLSFLVGKLTGTKAGILIDHQGREDLPVSRIYIFIEEIVDKSSLEACALSLEDRESGSG